MTVVNDGMEIDVERDSGPSSKVTYTDKMIFTLTNRDDKCLIECCSESQVTSYLDFGTNYCNLEMLFCGSSLGCKPVLRDFENIVRSIEPMAGSTDKISDCLINVPTVTVSKSEN